MRVHNFFTDVDATINQTSDVFCPDCGQDMRWLLQLVKTGTDGDPILTIEESVDNIVWTPLANKSLCPNTFEFLLDDSPIGIKDSYFMGKCMRLKLAPNGNTTGTISAVMSVKTKSN